MSHMQSANEGPADSKYSLYIVQWIETNSS
jgi:hypothetical protein